YGTYLGDSLSTVVPAVGTPLYVAGVLGGHLVGRVQAQRIASQRQESILQANFDEPQTEAGFAPRLILW
ncbi:MAG: hypothetical protein ABI614_13925, partial [Planctomycetota bacterium]